MESLAQAGSHSHFVDPDSQRLPKSVGHAVRGRIKGSTPMRLIVQKRVRVNGEKADDSVSTGF
jgi:hypothetical protein